MRLATLRTPYGNQAIRIEANGIGTALDFEDIGQLLRAPDWSRAAGMSGEPVAFLPEDLAPVIPSPWKIICVEHNYVQCDHREGGTDKADETDKAGEAERAGESSISTPQHPGAPTVFAKFADALTGPYDPVHLPPHAQAAADYAGGLAVVIGKFAHNVTQADALDHVAGYAIINDFTLRDYQHATSQFHAGKSFYRSAGLGPWLTTSDEWAPGRGARITTTVNGELRQEANTDELLFPVAVLIEYCSSLYPLHPGDVIATGTPPGYGYPHRFLSDGDTARVAIDGLGHISNQTVFDATALDGTAHNTATGSSLLERDLLTGTGGCCGGSCGCGR